MLKQYSVQHSWAECKTLSSGSLAYRNWKLSITGHLWASPGIEKSAPQPHVHCPRLLFRTTDTSAPCSSLRSPRVHPKTFHGDPSVYKRDDNASSGFQRPSGFVTALLLGDNSC